MTPPESSNPGPGDVQGIAFTLDGVDELTFARILRDVMHDAAFGKPLQIQAQEPRPGHSARLTVAFRRQDRTRAVAATQRLKTLLLRYGVQVDSVAVPGDEERGDGTP